MGRETDPRSTSAGHRTVPHTADVILEAWAPTRERCLVEVVAALTDSFLDTDHAVPTRRHAFRLAATTDREAVLALLDEAIYLLDARGEVPVRTHLEAVGTELVEGWFDVADVTAAELVGSVPKGVALSGLVVEQLDGRWRCSATVDV